MSELDNLVRKFQDRWKDQGLDEFFLEDLYNDLSDLTQLPAKEHFNVIWEFKNPEITLRIEAKTLGEHE